MTRRSSPSQSRTFRVNRRVLGLTACAIGLLACSGAALGQDDDRLRPPTPVPPRGTSGNFIGMGIALVLGGLVIGVNLIPSKRGHQD